MTESAQMNWTDDLRRLGACGGAIEWASTQPDLATAWANCKRGDWMLWLVAKASPSKPMSEERKPLVKAACDFMEEIALPVFERQCPGDQRARAAVDLVRRWLAVEKVTATEMKGVAAAASDAFYDGLSCAAAGREAIDAAIAFRYAASVITFAACAAYGAEVASITAYYAAKWKTHDLCADIVRRTFPVPPPIGEAAKETP